MLSVLYTGEKRDKILIQVHTTSISYGKSFFYSKASILIQLMLCTNLKIEPNQDAHDQEQQHFSMLRDRFATAFEI